MGEQGSRPRSPRAVLRAAERQAKKQALAGAYDALTGITLASVLEAAPSFHSEGNLRAQLDTTRDNKPTAAQLEELAAYTERQSATLAALAADIRGCIQDAKDVEGILNRVKEIATRLTNGEGLSSGDGENKKPASNEAA